MTVRYTLVCPSQSLDAAQALADRIDTHLLIDALAVSVNETDEALAQWNTVAYFADESAAKAAAAVLGIMADIVALPDVDWVRQSLEGLRPVYAGRFQLYGAHDRARRRNGGHSFEIDAGTAFGTGHHGTTAGCLLIFDALLKRATPRRIFDLGCGTGVLALAAARATRAKVLATDIDPEAVRVTRSNAALNSLGPLVCAKAAAGLHYPAIHARAPYDLIFANILARPLASMARGLAQLLSPGGTVVLSGLTREQLRWISACYRAHGLIPVQTVKIENWAALALRKPGTKTKRPGPNPGRYKVSSAAPGWEQDL